MHNNKAIKAKNNYKKTGQNKDAVKHLCSSLFSTILTK